SLARLDQQRFRGPQEWQFGSKFLETDPETIRAQIEERKLLLLDERSHRRDRLKENLQLEMKSLDEATSLALASEKKMRPALLDSTPIVESSVNAIESEHAFAVLNSLPRFSTKEIDVILVAQWSKILRHQQTALRVERHLCLRIFESFVSRF